MDSDSKRQENQRVLVREEGSVMMAILIILFLLIVGILGILYVAHVHLTIKREFKEKKWMDNSEFDYGHDVRYDYTDY